MLTTGEVAKLFQVSAQTVINWLGQGRMPFERIGKGPRRLTEESVLNYITEIGISVEALESTIYDKTLRMATAAKTEQDDPAAALLNPKLNVMAWTEGLRNITGFSAMDVLGKSISHIVSGPQGRHQPIDDILNNGPWESNYCKAEVTINAKNGKSASYRLTASKFFVQDRQGGFLLVFY
jgi:excisionase family DNA binding protein